MLRELRATCSLFSFLFEVNSMLGKNLITQGEEGDNFYIVLGPACVNVNDGLPRNSHRDSDGAVRSGIRRTRKVFRSHSVNIHWQECSQRVSLEVDGGPS